MIHMRNLIRSFAAAFRGFSFVARSEQNMRIHITAGIVVLFAGYLFSITLIEWMLLILCISAVLITETINTCIECFLDLVHPTLGTQVQRIKDMMSASVVIASIAAVFVGLSIFAPRIWNFAVGLSY